MENLHSFNIFFEHLFNFRFINVCINVKDHKCTIHELAKKYNIPQWIVRIRHEFAHDQKLPPIYTCKKGVIFALAWLKDNYWYKEYEVIKDFVIYDNNIKKKQQLHNLAELYCDITLTSLENNFKTIKDLDNNIINKLSQFCGSELEKGWKQTNINQILRVMLGHINNLTDYENVNDVASLLFAQYLINTHYLDDKGKLFVYHRT